MGRLWPVFHCLYDNFWLLFVAEASDSTHSSDLKLSGWTALSQNVGHFSAMMGATSTKHEWSSWAHSGETCLTILATCCILRFKKACGTCFDANRSASSPDRPNSATSTVSANRESQFLTTSLMHSLLTASFTICRNSWPFCSTLRFRLLLSDTLPLSNCVGQISASFFLSP